MGGKLDLVELSERDLKDIKAGNWDKIVGLSADVCNCDCGNPWNKSSSQNYNEA